jgi:hypothetical protein
LLKKRSSLQVKNYWGSLSPEGEKGRYGAVFSPLPSGERVRVRVDARLVCYDSSRTKITTE